MVGGFGMTEDTEAGAAGTELELSVTQPQRGTTVSSIHSDGGVGCPASLNCCQFEEELQHILVGEISFCGAEDGS